MGGESGGNRRRFIVDHNVGKLARWLRMLGYDSVFVAGQDDSQMVRQALEEGRVILTRDTGIMKRRQVKNGRLKAVLLESEEPERQMRQLMNTFDLKENARPFTLCLECNRSLAPRTREEVADRVPPYVYRTQTQYVECPACHRIYWRGTHWKAMMTRLERQLDAGEKQ
ncbi:MAG: hypothetical protein A2Z29_04620 [Chloroflexi bacterium RBG_16_56_11]|nr:MAG: hypothetical protein A2Z29_04620 [Chloroflexi bacterium RBG_16_56_11]